MTNTLCLRYLSFHSPIKKPATIAFQSGMNVIYGASNTGKSFIVDAIDFMLGGKGPLRDIRERIGYNQAALAFETSTGDEYTVLRSLDGGAFTLFEGLYAETLPEGDGTLLGEIHSALREDNLSAFLLSKVGLQHQKIKKNKRNETNNLSFRNVARLVIVDEQEIIQQRSPLSDGNPIADTSNTSTFKLLLTGVDDSALVSTTPRTPEELSKSAQLELLDQLITDYQRQIKDIAGKEELDAQLEKLSDSMDSQTAQLAKSEASFKEVFDERRDLTKRLDEGYERYSEIEILLDRFTSLDLHYESDILRLRGIEEAGTLFVALADSTCPVCGALPEHHQHDLACDANVEVVVAAARAEAEKLTQRQTDLKETIRTLTRERSGFEKRLPSLRASLVDVSNRIDAVASPNLRKIRATYKELAEKSGEVKGALALHSALQDLEGRRQTLEGDTYTTNSSNFNDVELSVSLVDGFSTVVLNLLKSWHFPNIDRVSFDLKSRDLVINGNTRTSYGKGLRAITQAAFSIGLMDYCKANDTPHPGFVVMDSPLLSYSAPDSSDDSLSDSDLLDNFYNYLATKETDRQVIVIENERTGPPVGLDLVANVIKFTGSSDIGRQGLFPLPKSEPPELELEI